MSLKEYAERELGLSGMCGEAWNEGQLSTRIMELIEAFRAGEHSGGSAGATIGILKSVGWEHARVTEMQHGGPVQDVINVFSKQAYKSDLDAVFAWTRFLHLAQFRPLGAGGNTDPAQFKPSVEFANDITEYCDMQGSKQVVYQSSRSPTVFSADSGKTWYDLDNPDWAYPSGCTPTPMPGNA